MEDSKVHQASEFSNRLKAIIDDCDGVKLVGNGIVVRSEEDVTLDDMRYLRRLDRDYRSQAPKPGGDLPPPEI